MPYRLNRRSLAVTRVLPRGKDSNKRLKYVHVGPKGTTVVDEFTIARVSLPTKEGQPTTPAIYPESILNAIGVVDSDEIVSMPEGLPAQTGPEYAVPVIESVIPDPGEQTAYFTCDANALLKLLKVALDVVQDSDNLIRLRVCPKKNVLRIDSYAQPEQQQFLGVLKGIEYNGKNIPGDVDGQQMADAKSAAYDEQEKVKHAPLPLTLNAGRKFRG